MIRYTFIVYLSFVVHGCDFSSDWSKFGAPTSPTSITWKKEGYSIRMNEIELAKCGYPAQTDIEEIKLEQCMLDKGFRYADGGWSEFDPQDIYLKIKSCGYVENQNKPACQSLRISNMLNTR